MNKVKKIDEKYKEEEDDGGRNGKQQYDNVLLLGEETKGKDRRNWYHIISAHQKCDHAAGGHPDYLTVYIMKSCRRNNNSSIHGAELKQENNTSQPLCHTW